ncbi:hypothetical protein [Vibrio coralliilyticus]|uniref:hypothetical protein n=1 Tax=Vibrio coralliilyticus TaxID=190893 RepID=UPI001E623525|nr:hypothetical protein [Vibrio coralliilyticus]MCC2524937.1 hypothetical protein [Vibrio coralliilyticus]
MIRPASSALLFLSLINSPASAMEEKWSLEVDNICDSVTVSLPLPALDMSCDLDSRSGNPSKWFNPYETCELSFDMIGLPSLGDIAAGLAGAVCHEIQEVKSQTVDELIDQINEQIPDSITDDITADLNLNDQLNNSNAGSNQDWRNNDVAQPSVGTDICYTTDTKGSTITVPCDIASNPTSLNNCYVKTTSHSNPFQPLECSRFNKEKEVCIVGWRTDRSTGKNVPILDGCNSQLRTSNAEACSVNGETNYCTHFGAAENLTQNERLCSTYSNSSDSSTTVACSTIEKSCYGHLNGSFQAASCLQFHDQYFSNKDPYSNYDW